MRLDPGGLVLHADISALTAHLCNDMVVDAQGSAWVGNFGFDLDADLKARGLEVLTDHPVANLVRIDADGTVHLAARDMHFPNGSVITPDGRTLIVGESFGPCLTAFDVAEDGSLSGRREWARMERAVPDGICLDAEDGIWVASPVSGAVLRLVEGGEVTDRVEVEHQAFACMLGGPERRTLFICTAADSDPAKTDARSGRIESVEVEVPGAGLP